MTALQLLVVLAVLHIAVIFAVAMWQKPDPKPDVDEDEDNWWRAIK